MRYQTQGTLSIVGAMGAGIFVIAFIALFTIGSFAFSPAVFLAGLVAAVATLVLFIGFHEKPTPPVSTKVAEVAQPPVTPAPSLEPTPAVEAKAEAPAASDAGAKPQALDAPEGAPDDLKLIKGVGPKLEGLLNSMGFYHFRQVASWTADEIAWVDDNLEGFKGRVSRDGWVVQAKVLASGSETEFSKGKS